MTVAISSQPKKTQPKPTGEDTFVEETSTARDVREDSFFFQAIGIVSGFVDLNKEQPTVAINKKEFPLLCFPPHTQVIKFLEKEIEATNSQYQKLIVYPKVVHFPENVRQQVKILLANVLQSILHRVLLIAQVKIYRYCSTINFIRDYFRQQYQVKFCLLGYVGSGKPEGTLITDRLRNNEFQLKGLWQFIPPCKVPCITIYRNDTRELKNQLKKMSEIARHKTLKANHIPVLWRESSVKPFRYNRHLSKSEQGQPAFVQIRARFLSERDAFGFIEEEAPPICDRIPRFLRQKKAPEK